jgi:hypothetical protein
MEPWFKEIFVVASDRNHEKDNVIKKMEEAVAGPHVFSR